MDCGDAPLTFLVIIATVNVDSIDNILQDNTIALKQLDKAHRVHQAFFSI